MAPEQQRGGAVDAAADVWGLGIVLHFAAAGHAALEDLADELDTDTPQLEARVPALRMQRPRLAVALTDTVDACLAPDPAGRPPLAAVLRALEALT